MDFRQLEYFQAVVEAGSVSRAAKKLNLTQPPVSLAVTKLERELGVRLLERTAKGVHPTSAGLYLLANGGRLVAERDRLAETLVRMGDGVVGDLRIGVEPMVINEIVADLGEAGVAELFDSVALPLVAGQCTAFTGRAVAADGGYRISGSWQFAPGLSMATHVNLAATTEDGDQLVCVAPRWALRVNDNWDMLGLRATASLDYTAEDVFVLERFTFRVGRENIRRGSVVNRLSPALVAGLGQAAWAQGVARRMLDELRALTPRKDPAEGAPVTSGEFFAEYARHFSHTKGTMALLRETWRNNETTLAAGEELSDEQETMSRLESGGETVEFARPPVMVVVN